MSMSPLLDIGNTALTAQRIALQVTSENIANVNTPGYSRQSATLTPGPTYVTHGHAFGSGVMVSGIERSYDGFIQRQLLAANASSGQAAVTDSALQMVQPLFNDLSTGVLGSSLQNFFSAWQDLTANPQGVPERQAVLSKAENLLDDFHRTSRSLTDIKHNMNQSLEGLTSDINDALKQVASLNIEIKQVEALGGNANELRDQRDLFIRDLSQKVGVVAAEQSDGTITVTLPPPNGQKLVEQENAATFSLQTNAVSGYYDVMLTPVGAAMVNATSFVGGADNTQGAIGGMLQIRDVVVNKYLADLDEFATALASQVNSAHAAGFDLSGTDGVDFFNASTTAAGLELNITSGGQIAAADTDPLVGGTGNNKNAQTIAGLYSQPLAMSSGNMTLAAFYNSLVGKVGVDVQQAGRADVQSKAIINQLTNLRESVSGVSLDEELVNLSKFQKAYEGAAKLINVGTEMMDTVLGLIR